MNWVDADYENPLTVVLIWISALLPWDIAYVPIEQLGIKFVYVRWWITQYRHLLGGPNDIFMSPWGAYQYQAGMTLQTGYLAWNIASALFLVTLVFSLALFLKEDRVTRLVQRVGRPGRVGGALLAMNGAAFLTATAVIYQTGAGGIPVPAGAVLMLAFGGLLLTNQPENTVPADAEQPPA